MKDEFKIWEIDLKSKQSVLLKQHEKLEQEKLLEDLLVQNPTLLMEGLRLVGRQILTDSGVLDLLGVDANGNLVVFELKRERLARDAVAQIIDYWSYLDTLSESDLKELIEHQSGNLSIEKIDLKPIKMALVGLGVDPVAHRMVQSLSERGVEISLLTFHGYEHGDKLLLGRQAEINLISHNESSLPWKEVQKGLRQNHNLKAVELKVEDLWQDAIKSLDFAKSKRFTKSGITWENNKISISNENHLSLQSVNFEGYGEIRVTFFPNAVHLYTEKFQDRDAMEAKIPFKKRPPSNATPTDLVFDEWYCVLNEEKWSKFKDELIKIAKAVDSEWKKLEQKQASEIEESNAAS